MVCRPFAFREKQHNFFGHSWKYTLLEHHEAHLGEPPQEKRSNRRGVVDGEKLRRQDEAEPPLWLQTAGGVKEERRPRACQSAQSNSCRQCCSLAFSSGLACEPLITNVGRNAEYRIEPT